MLKVVMCFVKLIAELGKHFIWGKKKIKKKKTKAEQKEHQLQDY